MTKQLQRGIIIPMNQKIIYQGEEGSFGNLAAIKLFPNADLTKVPKFFDLFKALDNPSVMASVLPIENSLAGSVIANYDFLLDQEVLITNEIYLPVQHFLLGIQNSEISTITEVISHPKALEQCKDFFISNPNISAKPVENTALAAKIVNQKKDPNLGAIASYQASQIYNLKILKPNLEDHTHNWTRFVVIKKKFKNNYWQDSQADKLSLAYNLPRDVAGSLFSSLEVFACRNLNLTNIESRPIPGKFFEYVFYVDVEFGKQVEQIKAALRELESLAENIKVLGIYPKGEITFSTLN